MHILGNVDIICFEAQLARSGACWTAQLNMEESCSVVGHVAYYVELEPMEHSLVILLSQVHERKTHCSDCVLFSHYYNPY